MSEAKDILRQKLSETTSLKVRDSVVDAANEVQAASMLLLLDHRDEVNRRLDGQNSRFDQILEIVQSSAGDLKKQLLEQNVVLNSHSTSLSQGEKTMDRIDETTRETNGKVKKIRSELDVLTPEVKTLITERTERIIEDEKVRLTREGLLVLPRKIGAILKMSGKYIGIGLKWLGAVAIAWPAIVWLWEHRPFLR